MALTPKTKDELDQPVGAVKRKSNIRYAANTFSAQRSMADRWNEDGTFRDGSISGSVFKGSKIQRPGGPDVLPEKSAGRMDPRKTATASAAASRIAQGDDIYSGEGVPPAQTGYTAARARMDLSDPFSSRSSQGGESDPFRGPDPQSLADDPFRGPDPQSTADDPYRGPRPAPLSLRTIQNMGGGDSFFMEAATRAQGAINMSRTSQRILFGQGEFTYANQTSEKDNDLWSLKNSAMLRRTQLFSEFNGGR